MIYILKDYYYKEIIRNIEKCKDSFMEISKEDIQNKNLTNSPIYILINNKEEENLLKEDLGKLGELEELEILDRKVDKDNEDSECDEDGKGFYVDNESDEGDENGENSNENNEYSDENYSNLFFNF